ncbi:4-hydroxybenzoyl-CoA thioesterase [Mycobacterium sp. CBMA 234]|uniref:acyl-CoA thioesterase n=1 Tax=Mycolicibacterium sp. CBMA 234 TaxID=1918495 RepID=UPI0012DF7F84|nr:thioesterase family protein [Mycolicibacterium sp. CBMA 234]MUL67386.1 4-hydroxybenzoyl-CoA thioesterase [Mycolicibacterium sp. CBMA 234]
MEQALTVADFPVHWPVQTRWTDNDMFGHLNNAVYYELFDTAINAWINTTCDVDPVAAPWLGVVAESGCRYFAELKFPSQLVVGLAVTRLGNSSVTYRTALWAEETEPAAQADTRLAAVGSWVHVYVDRDTRRPVPIAAPIRDLLATAVVD